MATTVADDDVVEDSDLEEVVEFKIDVSEELQPEGKAPDPSLTEDPEFLPRETEAFPKLHPPLPADPSARKLRVLDKFQKEAVLALQSGAVAKTVAIYTEAMRVSGATAPMLANRAALMLKLRRPCATIRDCTAALQVQPGMEIAMRVRGIAHRRLGHWKRAHRDLCEAQKLSFDQGTFEMLRFLVGKLEAVEPATLIETGVEEELENELKSASSRAWVEAARKTEADRQARVAKKADAAREAAAAPKSGVAQWGAMELQRGQAVRLCGLQKAPHLNDKIGKVERLDPRPAQRGRWEIEIRLDGGVLELKSLKPENIFAMKFNSSLQADKKACRQWMRDEKEHAELRARREKQEEDLFRRKVEERQRHKKEDEARKEQDHLEKMMDQELREAGVAGDEPQGGLSTSDQSPVERKLLELKINDEARKVLKQLEPAAALDILERAGKASGISNLNAFVESQAKLALGLSDSDSEGEGTKAKRPRQNSGNG